MKPSYDDELDLKLNHLGQIDLDYYREKALNMRARNLARMRADFGTWLVAKLQAFYDRYLCLNCHAMR